MCGGLLCVVAPTARHSVTRIKSIDCVGKVTHEVTSPQFAIGKHTQTELLLLLKHPRDLAILQGLEFFQRDLSLVGLKQLWRAQKASNVIRTV
jgi:hypothetical protein